MTTIYMFIPGQEHPTVHTLDSISPAARRWAMENLIEQEGYPEEVLFECEIDLVEVPR